MYTLLFEFFQQTLDLSKIASIIIICVILCRILLRKVPKIFSYTLWGVVLFRLLFPFSFESNMALLPATETVQLEQNSIRESRAVAVVESSPVNIVGESATIASNELGMQAEKSEPISIAFFVWGSGVLAMLGYAMVHTILLKKRLIGSKLVKGNIYLADQIEVPFTMGILRPRIYIPSALLEEEYDFILSHEQCHIRRGDHITRLLAFVALSIHWFNPLVWLAFILSDKDMEMSCDEAVLTKMHQDIRSEYAYSLVRLSTSRRVILNTSLAFGNGNPKERVENIMKFRNPVLRVSILAGILVISISVVLMSSQAKEASYFLKGEAIEDLASVEIAEAVSDATGRIDNRIQVKPGTSFEVTSSFEFVNDERITVWYDEYDSTEQTFYVENSKLEITEPIPSDYNQWHPISYNRADNKLPLSVYLEAIKKLPQEEILSYFDTMPDRFSITLLPLHTAFGYIDSIEFDEERSIFYNDDNAGLTELMGYQVHLEVQALYESGNDGYQSKPSETLQLFYYSSFLDPEGISDFVDDPINIEKLGERELERVGCDIVSIKDTSHYTFKTSVDEYTIRFFQDINQSYIFKFVDRENPDILIGIYHIEIGENGATVNLADYKMETIEYLESLDLEIVDSDLNSKTLIVPLSCEYR